MSYSNRYMTSMNENRRGMNPDTPQSKAPKAPRRYAFPIGSPFIPPEKVAKKQIQAKGKKSIYEGIKMRTRGDSTR